MIRNVSITSILSEWAMRSPNGLCSDIYGDENLSALRETLFAEGMSDHDVSDILESFLMTEMSNEDVWTDFATKKRVSPELVQQMRQIVEGHLDGKSFLEMYDSIPLTDIDSALLLINSSGKFASLVSDVNGIRKPGLGRGELVLVFLLQGCISGGTTDTDLVFPTGEKIDVKETTRGALKLSNASVGLDQLEFYKDLQDLVRFISVNNPHTSNYIVRVLKDNDNFNIGTKIFPTAIDRAKPYFDNPSTSEVSSNIFDLLYFTGKKLKLDKTDSPGVVDMKLTVGKPATTMVVNNPDEVEKAIQNPQPRQKLDLDVSPMTDVESQIVIPNIKNQKYFQKNYSRVEITAQILDKMRHSNGLVILHENNYLYIPSEKLANYILFNRLTMGKSEMKFYPSADAMK